MRLGEREYAQGTEELKLPLRRVAVLLPPHLRCEANHQHFNGLSNRGERVLRCLYCAQEPAPPFHLYPFEPAGMHSREDLPLEKPRFKIAPSPEAEAMVKRFLPLQAEVTISCRPAGGISEMLTAAASLSEQGYRVIPHLPAQMIPSTIFRRKSLTNLTRSGIGRVVVMAGDSPQKGPYGESLRLMEDIAEFSGGSFNIRIIGHLEDHPFVPESILYEALLAKQHLASDLTTQLYFDARILRRYLQCLRNDGTQVPVWASAPCPLAQDELVEAISRVGVGASVHRIGRPGPLGRRSFRDGEFDLTRFRVEIGPDIAGLHVNTFNQFNDLQLSLMASDPTGATP